jgi:hypothetical protein
MRIPEIVLSVGSCRHCRHFVIFLSLFIVQPALCYGLLDGRIVIRHIEKS